MGGPPNGGMPPGPMPGGPMGPGGPMPGAPPGGPPPEWLLQQMMAEQQPQMQLAAPDVMNALMHLLDTWTERDPSTMAGQYYQDLANVVSTFMG